jgi:hypothetical protein
MERLLNKENVWDGINDSSSILGPRSIITEAEVRAALKGMKRGKAAGSSKVVAGMFRDGGDVGVKWLTELCNMIASEGHVPLDWQSSTLIPVFNGRSLHEGPIYPHVYFDDNFIRYSLTFCIAVL